MQQSTISLVVPTYQERQNILPLLEGVCAILAPWDYEIIVVDDCSPDGTAEVVKQAMRINPRIHLIIREGQRGLAGAVVRGFAEARGAILGSINADLSHDASIMPAMIRAIQEGAEMVVGSRRIPGGGFGQWPWYRRLASDCATALTRLLLNVPLSDPMSGFYFLRRPVFERARNHLQQQGFKIMLELAVLGKPHPLKEEPYVFKNRQHGSSKVSPKVALQFLRMLWRLRGWTGPRQAVDPAEEATCR